MIGIETVIFAMVKQAGKTNEDVKEVRPNNLEFPTTIEVEFHDGTVMSIEVDFSNVERH